MGNIDMTIRAQQYTIRVQYAQSSDPAATHGKLCHGSRLLFFYSCSWPTEDCGL
eukprot:COSAG01_NODE_53417_length_339_cov_0.879167_2_plen_53_part_01